MAQAVEFESKSEAKEPGLSVEVGSAGWTNVWAGGQQLAEIECVNDSDVKIYLRLGKDVNAAVAAEEGIPLVADGGAYSSQMYDGPISARAVSGSNKRLCITVV